MKANFFVCFFFTSQIPTFVVTYNTLVILFYFYILSTINKNCYVIRRIRYEKIKKKTNVITEKFLLFLTKMRGLNILSLLFLTSARKVFSHV